MPHFDTNALAALLGEKADPRTLQILELLAAPAMEAADEGPDDYSELDNRARGSRDGERATFVPRTEAPRGEAVHLHRDESGELDELEAELEELRHRNDALAAALGACAICWGESEPGACPECGGAGRPGAYEVDEELFEAVVGPAVQARAQSRRPVVGRQTTHEQGTPQRGGNHR